jgi:glycosyltransferase involved in cell wall biosynthesis
MKIALLGDGSLNHIRRWGKFFAGRGHRVALYTFEETPETGFPVTRLRRYLPTNLLGYLSSLPRLRKELSAFDPDIVNSLYISGYGLLGALSGRRPLVLSALGSDLLVDYGKHFVHRAQIECAIAHSDLVTVDSESLADTARLAGASADKILKVYFGIDPDIFHPPPGSGRGKGRTVQIISTRNLYRIYNLDLLVEAAPAILRQTDAKFIICGDGPLRKDLEEKAAELGVLHNFSFEGKLSPEALSEKLRESDIYISTSRSDSTSVSLLEAMACGVFPVVTDIEANREWIKDGINGIIVSGGEPEELAGAVGRALGDRARIAEAERKNLQIIADRGLWEDNMERAEEMMLKLLGG